jgi:hypothetical protein
MQNWNKAVKGEIEQELADNITCALIRSPFKPVIDNLTGYSVLTELSLTGESKLASELLRTVMIRERKTWRNSK